MNLAAPPRNPTISIVGGVKYISVDELTWIIAFNIIFFAIYISFFIKAKKWDKKLAKEENAVEAESEKEDDSE